MAVPTLSSGSEEDKVERIVKRSVPKEEPDPKAISCDGLCAWHLKHTWLRFVNGRVREILSHPVSLVVHPEARRSWQDGPASDLGQRKLARLQQALAREAEPRREGERPMSRDSELSVDRA